jgi:hypothetical protein
LEGDGNVGHQVGGLTISRGWVKPDQTRNAFSLFIEAMSQGVHDSEDNYLPPSGEGDAQYDVALDFELSGLVGVFDGRFRKYLKAAGSG